MDHKIAKHPQVFCENSFKSRHVRDTKKSGFELEHGLAYMDRVDQPRSRPEVASERDKCPTYSRR